MRSPIGVTLAFVVCASCSPAARTEPSQAARERPRVTLRFAAGTRPPNDADERATATEGVVFDPALDCVARELERRPGPPQPRAYRDDLPTACGSPRYVVDARRVPSAQLAATVDEMRKAFAAGTPVALGRAGDVVVIAARIADVAPVEPGESVAIEGTLIIPAKSITGMEAIVSRARGIERRPVTLAGQRFSLAIPDARDADVEIAMKIGKELGPVVRFRFGGGGGLASSGTWQDAFSRVRAREHLSPLVFEDAPASCEHVPAKVRGADVGGRARCFDVPRLGLDDVAPELAFRPMLQSDVSLPDARFASCGVDGARGVVCALLRPFEALDPTAGRRRVLDALRSRWPTLRERPATGIADVLGEWSHEADPAASAAKYKPHLDAIASRWTTTRTFYTALVSGRDLDGALALLEPDPAPKAIDVAFAQVRGRDGAMLHLVAVALELP